MDTVEAKQSAQSQAIGVFLVVFGAGVTWVGCRFHYEALTTSGATIGGAGLNMIQNLIKQILNNKQGGTVNLGDAA